MRIVDTPEESWGVRTLAVVEGIQTITIGCPESLHGKEGRREVAAFYAELLGMRIVREDWLKIAKDSDSVPQLALDSDGWSDERPPRWPDPEYPQQIHLDILVRDLPSTDELVLARGATRLQDKGSYRSYADPVGHPFCLYSEPTLDDDPNVPGVIGRVVFDCISPRVLAVFYEELLDMPVRVEDSTERVVVARSDGRLPMLGFQQAEFVAPRWPDPAFPAQLHLDIHLDDPRAPDRAEALGAIRLPDLCEGVAVYADPAGHPFCIGV